MPAIPVLSVSSGRNTNSSCAGTGLLVCPRLKSFHALCMHDDALDGMLTEASQVAYAKHYSIYTTLVQVQSKALMCFKCT
jgi:hypothetical protein